MPTGLTKAAGRQIGVSRTVPYGADRIRVTHGTTTVQVALAPAADGARTTLRFHQEHLASAEERERRRAHWRRVMDRVATALDRR